jgi:hypothetical protein
MAGFQMSTEAGLKLSYVSANCFDSPRDIAAEDLVFWSAQPSHHQAGGQRFTSHEVLSYGHRHRTKVSDSLLAQQCQRINRQRALRWNPGSQQSQQQHRYHDTA